MELHKSSPRTPQEKERVARVPERAPGIIKIESTDRAIDRLIYELYGLSKDEVKVVEGKE